MKAIKRNRIRQMVRELRNLRYGIVRRNKDLDWAKPYDDFLNGIALIILIVSLLVALVMFLCQ